MRRTPLSAERIIHAAAAVADKGGLGAVSMRNVGKELGVEAMSLYHHVRNKDALLDELAEWVFAQIELPEPGTHWRSALTVRCASLRAVLGRHPWSLGLVDSRGGPGQAQLRHHDAALGCLRGSGFSVPLAAHALSVLDSYVYGFVLTEQNLPFSEDEGPGDVVAEMALDAWPHLAELVEVQVSGRDYRYADEFGWGLDLILDGFAEKLVRQGAEPGL